MKLFTKKAVVFSILLGFLMFEAKASTPTPQIKSELHDSLVKYDLGRAYRNYNSLTAADKIPLLKELADQNFVLAQWFLSDALIQSGQRNDGLNWLYTASLGTRMDASICKNIKQAKYIEGQLLNTFDNSVRQVRYDEANRRNALTFALIFHSNKKQQSASSDWACSLSHPTLGRTRTGEKIITTQPARTWLDKRQAAYLQYQKTSGINPNQAIDLYKIIPVSSK